MHLSKLFIPISKDLPAEAKIKSHQLMLRTGMIKNAPLGLLIGAILLGEILFSYIGMRYGVGNIPGNELFVILTEEENTRALGKVIYTDYIYLFQCAGLILLVAMIGAIVLTHRKRENVKKQDAVKQTLRDKSESIEVNKVEIGKGVE